jgi:hypothetical protein
LDVTARLPDFIVAGVRKCGTTWLHRCLAGHPQIHLPTATKELFFFDRYWARGPDWYAGYFLGCPREMICGEISPSYFAHEAAPARIARIVPQVKLMFLLRDPVERAISAYRDMIAKGDTRLELSDALATHADLIQEGRYARHLARYTDIFAASAIRIVIAEEIQAGNERILSGVFDFFGVNNTFRAPALFERVHETRTPRSPGLAAAATGASRRLHRAGLHRVVALARAAGAKNLIVRRRPEAFAPPASVLARLDDVYARDIEMLSGMLNRNLRSFWPRRGTAPHHA